MKGRISSTPRKQNWEMHASDLCCPPTMEPHMLAAQETSPMLRAGHKSQSPEGQALVQRPQLLGIRVGRQLASKPTSSTPCC